MLKTARSILNHAVAEARQLATHPLVSIGNIPTLAFGLFKTFTVGMSVNAFLEDHPQWEDSKRGEYLWKEAGFKWGGAILQRAGITVRVIDQYGVDWSQYYVVAMNHTSAIDAMIAPRYIPSARIVAKSDALKFPIIGKAISQSYGAQIIVNRHNGSGMSSVREAMKDWTACNVLFFVEGTRSLSGAMQPFKAGAFVLSRELQRPILPVYVGGAHSVLPKGAFLALKRNQRVTVSFGRPIPPCESIDAQRDATVRAMYEMAQYERAFR